MRARGAAFKRHCPKTWLVFLGTALIVALAGGAQSQAQDGARSQLEAGKIIVTSHSVPGSSGKQAGMIAIIKAPPEMVWQIITDVNNYQFFMPRILKSMAVAPEKIPPIVQLRPKSAEQVEKLLGSTPANPDNYRIPGGKYTVYHYSNLNFPWPCSNRWYIVKVVQDETRATQHDYHLSWLLVIGNLRENSGEWLLEPYGNNQTKAIYRLQTDPGGMIPGFLIKEGTNTTMPQIIKAIRTRAAKLLPLRQP
jgi:ribosome-associated toxin RatA of RatAB toxin-antitoxin module